MVPLAVTEGIRGGALASPPAPAVEWSPRVGEAGGLLGVAGDRGAPLVEGPGVVGCPPEGLPVVVSRVAPLVSATISVSICLGFAMGIVSKVIPSNGVLAILCHSPLSPVMAMTMPPCWGREVRLSHLSFPTS